MRRLPFVVSLFHVLSLSPVAASADKPTHDIVPSDLFSLRTVAGMAISPSGRFVAFVESRWEETADGKVTDIWLSDTRTRVARRLTFSNESESSLQWSPDEKSILFKSGGRLGQGSATGDGEPQVFRLFPASGRVVRVTQEERGIKQFQICRHGTRLYYTTYSEDVSTDPWSSLRAKHGAADYGHGKRVVNPLIELDLRTWRRRVILDDRKVVWDFEVDQRENRVARITTADNELIHFEGRSWVEIHDLHSRKGQRLEDRQWRQDAPSPFGWIEGVTWSADDRALAFTVDYDGYPTQIFVAEFRGRRFLRSFKLDGYRDSTALSGDLQWFPNSRTLCYRADDHGRRPILCRGQIANGKQGEVRNRTPGNIVAYRFGIAGRSPGTIAFVHNGLRDYSNLYVSKRPGKHARITDINPHTRTWKLPSVRIVKWKAPDGTEVEGILELPPGKKPKDGPFPTVVQIHGGPTSATPFALRFRHYGQTSFAAQGWALFSPNYRGSTGYGDRFLTDLVGRENDIEVKDIISGLDYLVSLGVADADRLAVMGWSNGGYLTNALISTTERFKAASSGAGNFDQLLQWATEDTPGHVVNFMRGLPWQQSRAFQRSSPLMNAGKIATPTLIHVGENDARVPAAHSRALYRALRHYLQVPVELIVYPGEGHSLRRYKHRKAKLDWDLKWFNYYVLGKHPAPEVSPSGTGAQESK